MGWFSDLFGSDSNKDSSKEVKIWFSKEHSSKSNPEKHTDTYRKVSDVAKPEKIAHNPCPETKISINRDK